MGALWNRLREWGRACLRTPWRWGVYAACIPAVGWISLLGLVWAMPLPPSLSIQEPIGNDYVDRFGVSLRQTLGAGGNHGRVLTMDEVPDILVAATLAAEDKRFWEHRGVDWIATARAFRDWVWTGRVVSGASTITQQLIKNAQPRPRTIATKVREALQAMKLERCWTKRQILTAYLSRIDYGNGCTGAGAATEYYFAKPLEHLSPAEAALLAALPNAPSRLNPHRHLERAQGRQRVILGRMHANGVIPEPVFRRAMAEKPRLQGNFRAFHAPHFVDLFRQQHPESSGRVATTLDLALNQFAQRTLSAQIAQLRMRHVANGAVVVLDVARGDVLALVGSQDYLAADDGQVNGAWARRSAGSTLKPFTYLMALERGATAATIIPDVPCEMATATGIFRPHNYDHRCHGPVALREALGNSLNIPAVRILGQAGGVEALQHRLRGCGLTTLEEPAAFYGLGLTIGNAEVRLLELANAYACLARLGLWRPYRLQQGAAEAGVRWFDERASWIVADILADERARARSFGFNSPLAFDFPVACKTGTSTDFRDNWALGYTPEYVVGVWVGNFDGTPMRDVSGVSGAAPVMHALMEHLHRTRGTGWYTRPAGLVQSCVSPLTGKRVTSGKEEWFLEGTLPPDATPDDVDGQGRVRLDAVYRDWLASSDNWLGGQAVLRESLDKPFAVVRPLPGTVFYINPELPESCREIPLSLGDGRQAQWSSPSLKCELRGGQTVARLAPGTHRLRAQVQGQLLETWIRVEHF